MQLWLVSGSGVSIREQLVTQISLAVVSGDLKSGQRLPSTRQLARRFRVHPNTISAAYGQFQRERWVERLPGSGVYIRSGRPKTLPSTADHIDRLILSFVEKARELRVPVSAAREHIKQWLDLKPPSHFLLIEPDEELRAIVVFELQKVLAAPVKACGFQKRRISESLAGAIPLVLPSKTEMVREVLPANSELITLQIRSVLSSLAHWLPAPAATLVGVASCWPGFLKLARTFLVAAGFDPNALLLRDARRAAWKRGLAETAAVVCDAMTAECLPENCKVIPFPLVAQPSIEELRRHQEFFKGPNRVVTLQEV